MNWLFLELQKYSSEDVKIAQEHRGIVNNNEYPVKSSDPLNKNTDLVTPFKALQQPQVSQRAASFKQGMNASIEKQDATIIARSEDLATASTTLRTPNYEMPRLPPRKTTSYQSDVNVVEEREESSGVHGFYETKSTSVGNERLHEGLQPLKVNKAPLEKIQHTYEVFRYMSPSQQHGLRGDIVGQGEMWTTFEGHVWRKTAKTEKPGGPRTSRQKYRKQVSTETHYQLQTD